MLLTVYIYCGAQERFDYLSNLLRLFEELIYSLLYWVHRTPQPRHEPQHGDDADRCRCRAFPGVWGGEPMRISRDVCQREVLKESDPGIIDFCIFFKSRFME